MSSCRAADAAEGCGAGGQAFFANGPATHIAYFVYAGCYFSERRIDCRKLLSFPVQEGGNVLSLEGNRGAFRIVLIVAAGRALAGTGDDRAELPIQFGDTVERALAVRIQVPLGRIMVTHVHRLLL